MKTKYLILGACWVGLMLNIFGEDNRVKEIAPTAQEIAQQAFGATVLLVMEDATGQPLSLGSGFVLQTGEVVTNLHVVKGAVRGYAKLVGQAKKHNIDSVTAVDADRDLVVLKVSSTGWPSLAIGNSDGVQVGETVFAVGNPQGLEGTFSQGIVSSIRQIGTDTLLQITAPISPGSSGGPVLNARGEVIGVSVATFKGGQNLNFAIPANYLLALLDAPRTEKTLEQASSSKARSSIMADTGDSSKNGLVGSSFSYESNSSFSFSLVNMLRESVRNVNGLIVFYDLEGSPLDAQAIRYPGVINAGLAKRTSGRVEETVRHLNAPNSHKPIGRIEIRILNFEVYDKQHTEETLARLNVEGNKLVEEYRELVNQSRNPNLRPAAKEDAQRRAEAKLEEIQRKQNEVQAIRW